MDSAFWRARGRSSSAAKADADCRIEFARRNSQTFLTQRLQLPDVRFRLPRTITLIDLGLLHPAPQRLDTNVKLPSTRFT